MNKHSIRLITGLLEYIVTLLIILECHTIYRSAVNVDFRLPELTSISVAVLLLFEALSFGIHTKIINRIGVWMLFYCGYMVLFMLQSVSGQNAFAFFTEFIIILPLLTFIFIIHRKNNKPYRLLYRFSDIMTLLSVISLFFWLFASILHVLKPTGYILVQWGTRHNYPVYWGLYAERQKVSNIFRNQSIFCEGPMYSLCLVFAVATELFLRPSDKTQKQAFNRGGLLKAEKNHRKARTIILILALLSTLTTTGNILLIAMLVMRFLLIHTEKKDTFLLKWFVSIFIVVSGIIGALYIFNMKSSSGSWLIRANDFLAGFRAWLNAPLFGTGFSDNSAIQFYMDKSIRSNLGFSNSIFQVLSQGGVALFLVYFIAMGGAVFKSITNKQYHILAFSMILIIEFIFTVFAYKFFMFFLLAFCYSQNKSEAVQRSPEPVAERKQGIRLVWKPPIWLEEDDGKATGIREENISFGVFDTLIRRSVARPADLFRIMEQNDPSVPEHFAEKRIEAEQAARAKLGARMGLADIYEELLPLYGAHTNDLMALEIQYEIAGCRPVADNIDLVNLCMEHDKNVFLMADTYLPSSVLRRMLDVCGVYHYDRLYVSCEEGACKADGSLFWKVLADQEIRPHELRHIGSDRQGDIVEPWRVGVHVKRGKKKDQSAVEKELPEGIALYERTLQTCIRNCADDLGSADARLGCETFGPLLAGFTAWLREQLHRDGIQDVYFLAGDGSVLKQAFDALEDGGFRTYSLYFPVQTADQDHEALLAYIRACGMQGKVALVDTGRQAAVQKTLENLIAEAGLAIQIKGYYVGLADTDGMEAAGYLYEPGQGKETLEKLSPITVLFDTVFHAQHGPVRRIAMRDGQPVPELDAYEYASDEGRICDEIAILRAYQAGALTLVREMNGAFPGGVPQIPGEAAILPLLRMGTNPTQREAELWGDFRVFRDGKATLMARPKGKGAYLLHPGQLKRDYAASPWKSGFLRRLVRLPLAYDKIVKNR